MTEDQNRTLQDKFMLRFPEGMREHLKSEAAANNRSMNAEIIARLERTFTNPRAFEEGDSYIARLERQAEMLQELIGKLEVVLGTDAHSNKKPKRTTGTLFQDKEDK